MKFNSFLSVPQKIKKNINKNIYSVIKHGHFILGPEVLKLEQKLKKMINAKYCIGVSSGTDALLISLMALNIKKNDEVVVPAFSWISTASVIKLIGAKPIFVDIDMTTCNINEDLIEKNISKKTKAIIFVSLFGNTPNYKKIKKIGLKYKLPIIEDGAQSFGAKFKDKFSCNLSTIGCTSFFPSKPLGAFGDAGAIFTNKKELYLKMKNLRVQGQISKNYHKYLGVNGRIDTIQCAVLLAKIKNFGLELSLRKKKFLIYKNFFIKNSFKNIKLIEYEKYGKSSFAQFCLITSKRDFLISKMKKHNIPYAIYYPKPMDRQPMFKCKVKTEKSLIISKKILSLPFGPYIKKSEQKKITNFFLKYKKDL
jgi:UDP-2-acetamido-2-deoxy-ribo-hexuluronate aminotransferase